MALNFDVVGKTSDPIKSSYTWRDVALYSLGVGAKRDELDFLVEFRGPKVLPTFATIPSFAAMVRSLERVNADFRMVVHGEQTIVLHRPIPPSGEFATTATISGIYDKGKGASIVCKAETVDAGGEAVFDNLFTIFVRGAGGFGGERGPATEKIEPPDRAPDFEHVETTSHEQALLYRLSGDYNPLHADPKMATSVGFDGPILHGLCTYGFAGRAVVKHACGGDPARLRSFGARFAGIVYPGDTLTTRGWSIEPGKLVVEVSAGPERKVITNSVAEVATA